MGRTGVYYDNAKMESFFATLKNELIYKFPTSQMTREQVRLEVFAWIEDYYNRNRRHTANEGKLPPLVKREQKREQYIRNQLQKTAWFHTRAHKKDIFLLISHYLTKTFVYDLLDNITLIMIFISRKKGK